MIEGLITLDCEQGSEEWLAARLGIPTATGIKNIVTQSGQKSSGWVGYLAELIAESIEGSSDGFKSNDMQRGNELEPRARMAYEFETDNDVVQVIQVQAALWVTGYETWDFVSYCPEYQKQPLYIYTAERDPVLMQAFDEHIPNFIKTLKAYKGI